MGTVTFLLGHPKVTLHAHLAGYSHARQHFQNGSMHIQQRPFVGLHLRYFEGSGIVDTHARFIGKLVKYIPDVLLQLDMEWSYVSEVIKAHGYDPDTVDIFLATDNQRLNMTEAFLQHSNVHMIPPDSIDPRFQGMVDTYVLSKSSLFLGGPLSSMSFHVALYRELNGFDKSTNIMAAYQEIGYMNHFFMDAEHPLTYY